MNETSCFKVERDNHIAWLILNRPEKRNVMGLAFFDEIGACFDNFDRNPDIRVVIIRAEGKSFSAGTDLEETATLVSQRSADGRDKRVSQKSKAAANPSSRQSTATVSVVGWI
jgi:enoyl-CoA hydratase